MNEVISCKMSLEERRQLLDSAKGRYFSCSFVKADGSVREATCKKWEQRFLKGKPGENKNTVAHKKEYYTASEQAKEGWININLERLQMVKINSKIYKIEG